MELNPLKQIDPVVIVAVMIVFALTYVVLRRVFFGPYIQVMEERSRRLESGREQAEDARVLIETAEAEAAQLMDRVREKADRAVREARQSAEGAGRRTVEATLEEVGVLLEQGRARIAQARENELSVMRQEALDCVGLACSRLVGTSDLSSIEMAVDKLIARRAH